MSDRDSLPLLRNVAHGDRPSPTPRPSPRIDVLVPKMRVRGSPEWLESKRNFLRNTAMIAKRECELLATHVSELRPYVEQTLGREWAEFCRTELNADPAFVEALIAAIGGAR